MTPPAPSPLISHTGLHLSWQKPKVT